MCSSKTFVLVLAICLKLVDFVGDGFMMFKMISEFIDIQRSVNSFGSSFGTNRNSSFCLSQGYFASNENLQLQNFAHFSFILLSYGISVVFSFLIMPSVFCLSLPKKIDYELMEDDDDLSIDYDFREEESTKNRLFHYTVLLSYLFFHNTLSLALGIGSFSFLISPQGFRCNSCQLQSCEYMISQPSGWSSDLVFPVGNDFYLLIFVGGKLVGTVGVAAFGVFLEIQYRYHRYLLNVEQLRRLIRRNYHRRADSSSGCFWPWLGSFVFSIFFFFGVLFLVLAPTLSILLLRFSASLSLVAQTIQETILYLCYISWGFWGIFLLTALFGSWIAGISSLK